MVGHVIVQKWSEFSSKKIIVEHTTVMFILYKKRLKIEIMKC